MKKKPERKSVLRLVGGKKLSDLNLKHAKKPKSKPRPIRVVGGGLPGHGKKR
jgi:hypothetical protein